VGVVNFDPNDSILLVDAEVEGLIKGEVRNLRMVLDTGSSSTIIPWDVAMTLGYDPAKSASRKRLITGSGIEFAPRDELSSLRSLTSHRVFRPSGAPQSSACSDCSAVTLEGGIPPSNNPRSFGIS